MCRVRHGRAAWPAVLRPGDEDMMAELESFVAGLPRTRATPLMQAGRARLQAEQAHSRGDTQAAVGHEDEAITLLRSVGARPLLAKALLERSRRREDAAACGEARAICEELGAKRWLAKIDEGSGVVA